MTVPRSMATRRPASAVYWPLPDWAGGCAGYLVGKLVPRTGEAALMVAGAAALATGLAPLGSWPSRGALYGMLILIASGYGIGTTAVATLISRRTGRELQGEAMGLNHRFSRWRA